MEGGGLPLAPHRLVAGSVLIQFRPFSTVQNVLGPEEVLLLQANRLFTDVENVIRSPGGE